MKLKIIIHKAKEGGYWGEVPALPGCFSQGETLKELRRNLLEAIKCHLDVPVPKKSKAQRVQEVVV